MNTRRTRRRAFALPLVILLALVASLGIGLILSRTGSSNGAVNLQVQGYKQHHRHAGMREMVDRWLATTHGSMREQLESDGQAFTLELPRAGRVRVAITDGQGTLLDDRRGLYGPEARYTTLAAEILHSYLGPDPDPALEARYFRKVGPARISINSAPPQVVEAITTVIIPGRVGQRVAHDYLARRDRDLLAQADIRTIATEGGAQPEECAALEIMFTADPTVWLVDAVESVRTGPVARSGGLIEILTDFGSASASGIGSRTRFLSWEDLPLP